VDYKQAGVDIEKGDIFVSRIKKFIKDTYNENVVSGVGGFAALYNMGGGRYLASGTDGVGTKLKLAIDLNKHSTIGQDLVAMCVNDILCTGARPLFFLDYLATGKLDLNVHEQIVRGISNACRQSECVLIGGETAEMPGFYDPGKYDLAGFSVGEVYHDELITGDKIKAGDTLVAVASSGFHSNGYSLVRKLIKPNERDLMEQALTPTHLYVKPIRKLLKEMASEISGLAHITGGGFTNIGRMNSSVSFEVNEIPYKGEIPDFMIEIAERADLPQLELYRTFNMGVGFVIATSSPKKVQNALKEFKTWELGTVGTKPHGVYLRGERMP
jgi:phosphoribosylformylglycinamidine cyclo-ligase